MEHKLTREFYLRPNVLEIAKDLLGKLLVTKHDGIITSGIIVEAEAYAGTEDKASHAYNHRRTERTEIMYSKGGVSYVYLCYGIHHLFNVITNEEGTPDAVLIRAIEPVEGVETMMKRRNFSELKFNLTSGPGSLSEALGIKKHMTGLDLLESKIWIEDQGISFSEDKILTSPRVGVKYAEEFAEKPWRFRLKENPWTSPAR